MSIKYFNNHTNCLHTITDYDDVYFRNKTVKKFRTQDTYSERMGVNKKRFRRKNFRIYPWINL